MTNPMNTTEDKIYSVNIYDKDNKLIETHEHFSLEDAAAQIEEIESAPHLYPGLSAEII